MCNKIVKNEIVVTEVTKVIAGIEMIEVFEGAERLKTIEGF